jgi:hypothetical protein
MKKTYLNEIRLNNLVKRIILEIDEESNYVPSISEWVNDWFQLRRNNDSFGFPEEDGFFTFGGLFFFYNQETGCLELPPQNPFDWRRTKEEGIEVLERYYDRLTNIFEESGLGITIDMGKDLSMTICKN